MSRVPGPNDVPYFGSRDGDLLPQAQVKFPVSQEAERTLYSACLPALHYSSYRLVPGRRRENCAAVKNHTVQSMIRSSERVWCYGLIDAESFGVFFSYKKVQ